MSDQNMQSQDSKPDGQRFYHAPGGYQLILSLSKDEMECRAHLEVKTDGTAPTLETLQAFLATDGITHGVSEDGLQSLLAEALPGKSVNGLLACGTLPERGDDGKLELSFVSLEPPPVQTISEADQNADTCRVDFRVVQQFINVEPEQEIGRILPPTNGVIGKTVRSKPVPAEPGKPLVLKLGQNIRAGGDGRDILFAVIHGRVKQDGETIDVVEEYVVDGNVDFSVGNIRFNGFVEVHGDVLDGFQVSASKGLKITGNVGACRLISHGNIEFCGMDGQAKGSILCGGTITAHFIHDSSIECWGNMLVDVELRNCSVHCRKALVTGMLSGGDCVTLSGLEAKRLGAPSAIKTNVHSGIDYHDLDRMYILLEQLDTLQQQIAKTKDIQESKQLVEKKQQLGRVLLEVRSRRPAGSNPKINIKDRIHEGVTIYLGNAVEEFTSELSGPVSLIENTRDGGLRRLPLSSLDILASDLEQGWLDQDEQDRQQRLKLEAAEGEVTEEKEAKENTTCSENEVVAETSTDG